jgi:hypothetical protein
MLPELPAELQVRILSNLPAPDVSVMSRVNLYLNKLCHEETIWINIAKTDFNIKLKTTKTFSPRIFYQSVLYPFRDTLGLWQRQNLKYYSSILKVSVQSDHILFTEIIPPAKLREPFTVLPFLKVFRNREDDTVKIRNLNKIAISDQVKVIAPLAGNTGLSIIISNIEDHTMNPSDWRQVMLNFIGVVAGGVEINDLLLMRFVQTYHSRALYSYSKLDLFWPEITLPIRPGVFIGTYGAHGTEMINLTRHPSRPGTCGVKVTGDPNVPFGEISFHVGPEEQCLRIPREDQENLPDLVKYFQNPTFTQYQENLELDYTSPAGCSERATIPYDKCKGRWMCECQIAQHGFRDPSFIPGNFILFSEDEFAVLFIELASVSLFRRVTHQL